MKFKIGLLLIFIGGFLLGFSVKKPEIVKAPQENSQYEVTLKCQELSAIATNPDWGYESCIKEMNKNLNKFKTLEAI